MDTKLFALYIAYLLTTVNYALIGPFYPSTAILKGVPEWTIGLIFSTMPLACLIASPFVGQRLVHYKRLRVLQLGLFLQAGAMCLLAASHSTSATVFIVLGFLSRVLSGLSLAFVMCVCYSIVGTDYPETLPACISGLETSSGVGLMLGPILGSLAYETVGFAVIFYFYAGLIFLSIPIYFFIKTGDAQVEEESGDNTVRSVLTFREIVLVSVVCVYTLSTNGFIDAYIGPHVVEMGLDVNDVGYLFACYTIAYTIVSLVLGRIKNLNLKGTIVTGLLINLLGLCLTGPIEFLPASLIIVGCGLGLMGSGMAMSFVPMVPYTITAAESLGMTLDVSFLNAISSIVASSYSLGEIIGPAMGGVLLTFLDFIESGIVLFGIGVALTVVFVFWRRKNRLALSDSFESSQFYVRIHTSLFSPLAQ